MLLEAQSIAAKNTNKAKKLDEEIAEAHGALRMLHAMKVIRNKMHVAKIKKEQELTDKLINDNERRYVEIQELKKELQNKKERSASKSNIAAALEVSVQKKLEEEAQKKENIQIREAEKREAEAREAGAREAKAQEEAVAAERAKREAEKREKEALEAKQKAELAKIAAQKE